MNIQDELVSVVLITELATDEQVLPVLKNIREQTHKNIDLIVSSFREDVKILQEKASKIFLNARWIVQKPNKNFINDLLKIADGKFVFYKTLNNILWYPRHIQAHLEQFNNDLKAKWSLSHIEYRNLRNPNHPLSVLGFRIDNPPAVEKISLDEICHQTTVPVKWEDCLLSKDGQALFYAGYALKSWNELNYRGCIPNEITVIEWVNPGNSQESQSAEDVSKQIGVPASTEIKENTSLNENGDIEILRVFPTIVGNKSLDEYTNHIRHVLSQTTSIKSIGLKRSIGMGDVILCEPIIKKLRQKYPQAKITFYTAKPDIVKHFVNKPDDVVKIEEQQLLQDFLATTDNQTKFDLDLAYESRLMKPFIDSYAEVCGIKFANFRDKYPQLNTRSPVVDKEYVVVCGDGSGWPGKTWSIDKYAEVISHIKSTGYEVVETGNYHTYLTDSKWHNCSLEDLIALISNCKMYIGADNGPMHIARGLNKPCIVIAGAALPYYTNPNREHIYYVQNNLSESLGIKHKQFFNLAGDRLTFVPHDEKDPSCGLKDIQAEHVIRAFETIDSAPSVLESQFYFNIPGWQYFIKNDDSGLIVRNDLDKHPDQDSDISTQYDNWKENYEKFAKPWVERIAKYKPVYRGSLYDSTTGVSLNNTRTKLLDIGASIGLTVKAAREMGYYASGIDINMPSIEKSRQLFPNEVLVEPNTIESLVSAYEKVTKDLGGSMENATHYDVITFDQVLEHISDPTNFLEKVKTMLKDDGMIFIGTPRFDSKDGEELFHKWGQIGTGEHTFLFTKKSIAWLMNKVNLKYEELNDSYDYGGFVLRCWK